VMLRLFSLMPFLVARTTGAGDRNR